VHITTSVVYSIQHYVIKFVSDLRHVGGFLRVFRFPPPIKLTTAKKNKITEILLKVALSNINPKPKPSISQIRRLYCMWLIKWKATKYYTVGTDPKLVEREAQLIPLAHKYICVTLSYDKSILSDLFHRYLFSMR
jgi:hypothetical protein